MQTLIECHVGLVTVYTMILQPALRTRSETVQLAFLISRLKSWSKQSQTVGQMREETSSPFQRWRASQDSFGEWRVVNDDHNVVCWAASKEIADEIIESHNGRDPIQSYEEWLHYKMPHDWEDPLEVKLRKSI